MPSAWPADLFRLLLLTVAEAIPDASANCDADNPIQAVRDAVAEACGRDLDGTDLRELIVAALQMYEDHFIPLVLDGQRAEALVDDRWKRRLPEGA